MLFLSVFSFILYFSWLFNCILLNNKNLLGFLTTSGFMFLGIDFLFLEFDLLKPTFKFSNSPPTIKKDTVQSKTDSKSFEKYKNKPINAKNLNAGLKGGKKSLWNAPYKEYEAFCNRENNKHWLLKKIDRYNTDFYFTIFSVFVIIIQALTFWIMVCLGLLEAFFILWVKFFKSVSIKTLKQDLYFFITKELKKSFRAEIKLVLEKWDYCKKA